MYTHIYIISRIRSSQGQRVIRAASKQHLSPSHYTSATLATGSLKNPGVVV